MPWKDAGISDGSGALRWPVQLRSRAALRWLSAIIAASLLLCIAWTYNADAYLLGAAGKLKGGYTADTTWEPMAPPPASSGAPRVAWINTPSAFPGPQAITDPLLPNLPAELADAVARFLARPVLSHEEAVEWNEEECPRAQLDMQVNQDQLRGEREQWLAVTKDGVQEMRDGAVEYLEERAIEEGQDALLGPGLMETAEGSRVPVEKGSRGVVIAAGNHRTVERALVLVKELRRLGWDGGVEVWHFEGEMDNEDDRKGLEAEGVAIRMVSALFPTPLCPNPEHRVDLQDNRYPRRKLPDNGRISSSKPSRSSAAPSTRSSSLTRTTFPLLMSHISLMPRCSATSRAARLSSGRT